VCGGHTSRVLTKKVRLLPESFRLQKQSRECTLHREYQQGRKQKKNNEERRNKRGWCGTRRKPRGGNPAKTCGGCVCPKLAKTINARKKNPLGGNQLRRQDSFSGVGYSTREAKGNIAIGLPGDSCRAEKITYVGQDDKSLQEKSTHGEDSKRTRRG